MTAPSASPSPIPAPAPSLSIRLVHAMEEYLACMELQRLTWGPSFPSVVPSPVLMIANRIGGVTAGAFHGDRLVGFVFGITGAEEGRLIHWSHMLAVHPEYRNLGLGRRLKEMQLSLMGERGVERVYWTYDPLVAKNAHFNLHRLGVQVTTYQEDMYRGAEGEYHDFGTDRFVVVRRLSPPGGVEPPPPQRALQQVSGGLSVVNPHGSPARLVELPEAVRVEIPADIDAERTARVEEALRWRRSTRAAFRHLLTQGYRVSAFVQYEDSGRCFYVLCRDGEGP